MEINKIYHSDAFKMFHDMEDKSVDYVFTSPPYNRKRNDKYTYYDDTLDDYQEFLYQTINESLRVAREHVFINVQKNYYNKREIFSIIGVWSDYIQEILIWEKTNPMPANYNNITNAYEFILVLGDKPLKANSTYIKNVISTSVNGKMPKEHKAVMKEEVADWVIQNFTKEESIVLDCFMGVGTTAISCIKNNRNYIGFEIVKQYCDMAEENIKLAKGEI